MHNLLGKYKDNSCPVCEKDLIFKADYTSCNCEDIECSFNKEMNFNKMGESLYKTGGIYLGYSHQSEQYTNEDKQDILNKGSFIGENPHSRNIKLGDE